MPFPLGIMQLLQKESPHPRLPCKASLSLSELGCTTSISRSSIYKYIYQKIPDTAAPKGILVVLIPPK